MTNGGAWTSTEIRGAITIGKFWKLYVQNAAFWGTIALCFDSKQSAILTQTFGHKFNMCQTVFFDPA